MKNRKRPELNREENHFVKATLIINDNETNDIPCKIYLPERTNEKPFLIFMPSVAPGYLNSHLIVMKDLSAEQARLSEYINRQS